MKRRHPIIHTLGTLCAVAFIAQPAISKEAPTTATKPTVVTATAKQASHVWPQDISDIKPDTSVIYGKLENGMKYIIMPNKQPPGRVSMRLHIAAGSLMEREDQRGVAHFLEHMVFNGSKHFPDSSKLIPKMQRLGIAFGAHANAYTSFDETVYMMDLPNNHEDTLKLGFDVMRDFADGAFLRKEEIDKERGVILSEKTTRDSVGLRLMKKQFNALMPEGRIAKRFPIGLDKVIKSAPRKVFTDFYHQYYTPDRITFILVGDLDPKEAEKRIQENFKTMKNPETPGKDPSIAPIPKGQGFQTLILSDKEVARTSLELTTLKPFEFKADTKANRSKEAPLLIANAIMGRRFSRLAKKEGATITDGGAFKQSLFKRVTMGGISVTPKNHNWKAALPTLEQEFRKATTYGFTAQEVEEIKAFLLNAYEESVKAKPSRKTNNLASSLARTLQDDEVFSSPEEDLAILRESLKSITPESCHEAFKKFWDTKDITLVLTTNAKVNDGDATLKKLYEKSQSTKVSPPVKKEVIPFAYTQFGKPGTITKTTPIKDLDFTQIQFANGVKCNFKKTDFKKNSISMIARIGGGELTMPKNKPGLSLFASSVFDAGGLGKHSSDDLISLLAGHSVDLSFSVSDDAFTFIGETTPKDLELQLQLLCAYLTDPGFRPEAERQFKAQLPAIYSRMKHSEAGAQSKLSAFLHGNDPRFVFPTEKQANALTMNDVKQWVLPALKNDVLEFSIGGDINPDVLLPILSRTIGALPQRATKKDDYADARIIKNLPKPPQDKRYTFDSRIPTGSAMVVWKGIGLDNKTVGDVRRLGILKAILSNRMREKIREELGEAYSPYAYVDASDTYKNLGYITAVSPGKPEQAKKVSKLIVQIADKLAKEGATEDELKRAVAPRLTILAKTLRQNSYWVDTVMAESQEEPYRLDWARSREQDYKNIKVSEINQLAKKYLGAKNAFRIEIIPTQKEKK